MKLGIFSDTHDKLENVEKAVRVFQKEEVESIVHCGDWVSPFVPQFIYSLYPRLTVPVISVFGNNEGDHFRFLERKKKEGWNIEFYKETHVFDVGSKKAVVYHGSSKALTDALISCKTYDLVLTGHTHRASAEIIDGILHINPGSTAGYCEGRIKNSGTIAIYDENRHEGTIIDLQA